MDRGSYSRVEIHAHLFSGHEPKTSVQGVTRMTWPPARSGVLLRDRPLAHAPPGRGPSSDSTVVTRRSEDRERWRALVRVC
jgi:hypothetical protein